ncbi:MAG: hypothetical protein ACRD38_03055 [Nitrososphaerales archaeon]
MKKTRITAVILSILLLAASASSITPIGLVEAHVDPDNCDTKTFAGGMAVALPGSDGEFQTGDDVFIHSGETIQEGTGLGIWGNALYIDGCAYNGTLTLTDPAGTMAEHSIPCLGGSVDPCVANNTQFVSSVLNYTVDCTDEAADGLHHVTAVYNITFHADDLDTMISEESFDVTFTCQDAPVPCECDKKTAVPQDIRVTAMNAKGGKVSVQIDVKWKVIIRCTAGPLDMCSADWELKSTSSGWEVNVPKANRNNPNPESEDGRVVAGSESFVGPGGATMGKCDPKCGETLTFIIPTRYTVLIERTPGDEMPPNTNANLQVRGTVNLTFDIDNADCKMVRDWTTIVRVDSNMPGNADDGGSDFDGDGTDNATDPDDDNDTISDATEEANKDATGKPKPRTNPRDPDTDGDLKDDNTDPFPKDPKK